MSRWSSRGRQIVMYATGLALFPGITTAQDRRDEQFYYPGSFNWVFLRTYPEAARLFNAFDYGHAVLYERLYVERGRAEAELEKEYRFLTTDLLIRPPRLAIAEEVVFPAYAKLAWRAKVMFDWAHLLHRQIYDVYADERLGMAAKDSLIERLTDYYLSRKEYAFPAVPKSMELMDEQYFSQTFRRAYPKFNGLIWAYHWLQVGLYEPFLEDAIPAEKKAGVKATLARFWSMLEDAPQRMPKVMPMTVAVAPRFSARHPRAAAIFDNLHMTHDIISDILTADTVPYSKKRQVIYAQLDRLRDTTTQVMTWGEWRDMAQMMGGVAAMGGPATGLAERIQAGVTPQADTTEMDHRAMRHPGQHPVRDSTDPADSARMPHDRRHPAADTAQAPDSAHRQHGPSRPAAGDSGAGMEHTLRMMELYRRMMTDPIIRKRVMADTAMRRMMREMTLDSLAHRLAAPHQHDPATSPRHRHGLGAGAGPSEEPEARAHQEHEPEQVVDDSAAATLPVGTAEGGSGGFLPMHAWHPIVVHLPLVGLILAVLLDGLSVWTRHPGWRGAATVLWWAGLVGAAAAVATGLLAFGRVDHSDTAHELMTRHRNLAYLSLGLLIVTALWRWKRPGSQGAAVLGIAGALGLAGVGYLGGEMTYGHALGIPTSRLHAVIEDRGDDLEHPTAGPDSTQGSPVDSMHAPAISVPKKPHTHSGNAPHVHY